MAQFVYTSFMQSHYEFWYNPVVNLISSYSRLPACLIHCYATLNLASSPNSILRTIPSTQHTTTALTFDPKLM